MVVQGDIGHRTGLPDLDYNSLLYNLRADHSGTSEKFWRKPLNFNQIYDNMYFDHTIPLRGISRPSSSYYTLYWWHA